MKTIKYIISSNIIYLLSLKNNDIILDDFILNTLNLNKSQQIDVLLGNLNIDDIDDIADNLNNNIFPWTNFNKPVGVLYVYANGTKYWSLNGQYHRKYGPAYEYADGSKCWYLHGKRNREDGPACEYSDGNKYWYLNGKEYTEEEYNRKIKERQSAKHI